jgi:4'-phosphopantetheinyl transferase
LNDADFFEPDIMPELNLHWPAAPAHPSLGEMNVHVLAVNLGAPPGETTMPVLSHDERQRAARFHFEQDRHRFIAGRGMLRVVLAAYLQIQPVEVCFNYGARGKPFLYMPGHPPLYFNLAHSGDLALVAVSRCCSLGVDVEQIRPMDDARDIAASFFSRRESRELDALPPDQQTEGFFNLWTRKEACLKATGEGLSEILNQIEVTFVPGQPVRLLRYPGELDAHKGWTLAELKPAANFVGAIAARVPLLQFSCWRWPSI